MLLASEARPSMRRGQAFLARFGAVPSTPDEGHAGMFNERLLQYAFLGTCLPPNLA